MNGFHVWEIAFLFVVKQVHSPTKPRTNLDDDGWPPKKKNPPPHRAPKPCSSRVTPSAFFYKHELIEAHDHLVSLLLTLQWRYNIPPTQSAWSVLLTSLMEGCSITRIYVYDTLLGSLVDQVHRNDVQLGFRAIKTWAHFRAFCFTFLVG